MVVDCVVKEFKLYDNEAETAAREIKALSNDGYKVSVHYSAGNIGGVLIVATKEDKAAMANDLVSAYAEDFVAASKDKPRRAAKKKETSTE